LEGWFFELFSPAIDRFAVYEEAGEVPDVLVLVDLTLPVVVAPGL